MASAATPQGLSLLVPRQSSTENNSRPLMDTCIVFIVLETLFILMLLGSRFLNRNKLGNGFPMLMAASYLICVMKITLAILLVKKGGAGRHIYTLTLTQIRNLFKLLFALQIVCPMSTSIIKLTILVFYHRIFGFQSKNYRLAIYTAAVVISVLAIIQLIIPLVNCMPIQSNWDLTVTRTCRMSGMGLWRYLSIPNVLTSIMMLAIPAPAVWKLKVGLYTMVGLWVTGFVCLLGIAAAIGRFISFLQVSDFSDISYYSIGPFVWTIIESGIYLMAGIMPALHPLVTHVFKDGRIHSYLTRTFGSKDSGRFHAAELPPHSETGHGNYRVMELPQESETGHRNFRVAELATERPRAEVPGLVPDRDVSRAMVGLENDIAQKGVQVMVVQGPR